MSEAKTLIQKICPFLTLGRLQVQTVLNTLQPQQAGIVGAEIQVGFIPCQKEKCGLWAEASSKCSLAALGDEAAANGERLGNVAAELSVFVDRLGGFESAAKKQADSFQKIAEGYQKKTAV